MHQTARDETRTLTVVLPESDWRAFRAAEPDAVGWLQEQIRSRLANGAQRSTGPADDIDDDY